MDYNKEENINFGKYEKDYMCLDWFCEDGLKYLYLMSFSRPPELLFVEEEEETLKPVTSSEKQKTLMKKFTDRLIKELNTNEK